MRGARRAELRSVWRRRSPELGRRAHAREAASQESRRPLRPIASPLSQQPPPGTRAPHRRGAWSRAHTSGGRPARVRVTLVTGGQGMSRHTPRAPAALRPRSPRPPMSDAESLADGARAHACRPLLPARALPPTHPLRRVRACVGCVESAQWSSRAALAGEERCPWRGARPPPLAPHALSHLLAVPVVLLRLPLPVGREGGEAGGASLQPAARGEWLAGRAAAARAPRHARGATPGAAGSAASPRAWGRASAWGPPHRRWPGRQQRVSRGASWRGGEERCGPRPPACHSASSLRPLQVFKFEAGR